MTRTDGKSFTSVAVTGGRLVVGLGGEQWAGKPGWVTAFIPGTPPPTPTPIARDTTPPVIEFLSPKDGEVLPSSPKELKARVIDLESGVDPKSISVGLPEGIVLTVGSPGSSFTETKEGVDFAITIVRPFPPGTIGWEVSAKDKAGNGVAKKATFTIAPPPPPPSLGAQKVELTVAPYSTAKYAVALRANQRLDVNFTVTMEGLAFPDIHFYITNSQGQIVWDYGVITGGGPFWWLPYTSDTYTLIFSNQGLVTSLYTKRITLELKY